LLPPSAELTCEGAIRREILRNVRRHPYGQVVSTVLWAVKCSSIFDLWRRA